MSDEEVKKEYLEKVSLIKKYNKEYHNNDSPTVTDNKYDRLKIEVLNLDIDLLILKFIIGSIILQTTLTIQ